MITFEKFKELAQRHNLIPLYNELPADLETPISAFLKIKTGQYDFLYESVVGGEKWARYSFLGTRANKTYQVKDGKLIVTDETGKASQHKESAFSVLRNEFNTYNVYQDPKLPRFFGGAVGYIGYDMIHHFDDIILKNSKDKSVPDLFLFIPETVVIFDNLQQVMKIVCTVSIPDDVSDTDLQELYDDAAGAIDSTQEKLKQALNTKPTADKVSALKESASMDEAAFCKIVDDAKEYIKAGDIFQVVLSLKFQMEAKGLDPMQVYRAIRRINPSPYMFYLQFKDFAVVGASPEVLVRVEDGHVEVRPIGGRR